MKLIRKQTMQILSQMKLEAIKGDWYTLYKRKKKKNNTVGPALWLTNWPLETTLRMSRVFEQRKMREHLVKCLERGLFEPFPRNKVTPRFSKRQNYYN